MKDEGAERGEGVIEEMRTVDMIGGAIENIDGMMTEIDATEVMIEEIDMRRIAAGPRGTKRRRIRTLDPQLK